MLVTLRGQDLKRLRKYHQLEVQLVYVVDFV